ncbi:MAG TPA: diacylglycerol kinase family protein [Candidatus Saccharimonadia bacterium]|jgi:diacylglycerol kinase family enzyme|nr:diacylglycerol kinase family protein [Candidatus Saccharimonadia bacterium]
MYYYIVNPAAGHGQVKTLQEKLRTRLDELGIRGEWAKTTGPGDATRLAKAAVAAGHTTIVAVGGDDTVNEVINGVESDNVAVGIIPIGTGNRVANQLGIITWPQACEALAARRLTPYSLIAAGQKFFLSTLTLGFETDLDKTVDTTQTGMRARLKQYAQSFGHASNFGSLKCHIEVDGAYTLDCDMFTLSVSNQKFLNPLAENRLIVSLSDRPAAKLKLGGVVWKTLRNRGLSALEDTATTRFLANRVVIETDPPTGIMVDGKVAGRTPIAIRLTDRRIRFVTEKIVADFKDAITQKP